MEKLKKTIAMVIFACLCFSIFVMVPAEAVEVQEYEETFGYSQMKSDEERRLYVAFYEAVRDLKSEVEIPKDCHLTVEQVYNIASLLANDLPKAFYFRGAVKVRTSANTGDMRIFPLYKIDDVKVDPSNEVPETIVALAEIESRKQQLNAKIAEIISQMPASATTDIEKTKYIHDYIINNVTYQKGANDQTIYGALMLGKCVCAGYSNAFAALCHEIGIKCWVVIGTSINTGADGAHGWNVAWINGECLYTDVTWDDKGYISYKYFNANGMAFNTKHAPREDYALALGVCNHQSSTYCLNENTTVSLDKAEATMYIGEEVLVLNASVYSSQNIAKTLAWTTSDSNVVTVSGTGAVTAVGAGKATITVTHLESGKSARCIISVEATRPHQHSISSVTGKDATCTEPGIKSYFQCSSCGMRFHNEAGTEVVTDDQQLKLEALGHVEREEWSWDTEKHWKTCSVCDTVLEQTVAVHAVNNGICETCGYQYIEPTTPQTTGPAPISPTTAPKPTMTTPTTPIESSSSDPNRPTSNPTEPSNVTNSTQTPNANQKEWTAKSTVVIVGVVLCVVVVVTGIYIVANRKK